MLHVVYIVTHAYINFNRMKNLNHIFFGCLLIIGFVACSSSNDEPAPAGNLTCKPNQISAGYEESTETIDVTADGEWTAYTDDKWITCSLSGTTQKQGTITVVIAKNPDIATREGTVVVKSGSVRATVVVKQEAKPETPVDPDITVPEGYRLVWNDEFESGAGPDLNNWKYETGHGDNGWGNNEIQNYIAGSKDGVTCAEVNDGILKIIAQKVGNEVYSVRMNTQNKWKYGWFEARLKLPKGKGTWPAFWMLPDPFTSWPDGGEIDIMEEVGYDANKVLSTIHCGAYNGSNGQQKGGSSYIPTAQTEFHIYAVEWTEEYLSFLVDGKEHFRYANDGKGNATWPFTTNFNLKLNLAWGGNWGGAQGIDESALPATYEIDYVRVFQKK